MKSKLFKAVTIISGILTGAICLVMNFYLIPRIEMSTEGIKCFDMNPGYNLETATKFLSLLSEDGKSTYLNMQLPLDFVYPIAYTVFFLCLIYVLTKKRRENSVILKALPCLPVLLCAADYTENVLVMKMLKTVGALNETMVRIAGTATIAKTALMYGIFVILAVLLIIYIRDRRKNK